jgi:hypothetical protein
MAKRKRERQTIQWPNEKEKDRQYNGQMKKRSFVCLSLFHLAIVLSVFLFFNWPLYCLSFSFSFGYCIVCLSLFHLAIVLSVFHEKEKDRQYNSQMKKRKTDNTMAK